MKPSCSPQISRAFTAMELLIVLGVSLILLALFLPSLNRPQRKVHPQQCITNLKQIGLAHRMWANDHNDKYPMAVSVTNGGSMEMAITGNVTQTFLAMSNELCTPVVLICPQDTNHQIAKNLTATNIWSSLSNQNISYFVGVDADESDPQRVLSGDSNFKISGVPVKSGLLEIYTNTPIAWSTDRHKFTGYVGLADGSVQSVTSSNLSSFLHQSEFATNRTHLAIP